MFAMSGNKDKIPKRKLVLLAAIDIMRELGGEQLTLDLVAKKAGVSKGGLLYHFPSKEALVLAAVGALTDSFEADWPAGSDRIKSEQEDGAGLMSNQPLMMPVLGMMWVQRLLQPCISTPALWTEFGTLMRNGNGILRMTG